MLRKIGSMFLTFLIGFNLSAPAQQTIESEGEARVKAHIEKYGIGQHSPVELLLQDKQKWKGYIDKVHADGFVLIYNNSGNYITFKYSQVKQIKSTKLNPGKRFALWTAVTGGILVLILFGVASQD